MMQRLAFLTVVLTVLVMPGCVVEESDRPQPTVQVALNEEFVLAMGETAEVVSEDMRVTFAEVVSDSRCPEGAQCIEAGEIVCLLEIDRGGVTDSVTVTEEGLFPRQTQEYLDYVIVFHVVPYPEMGKEILPEDYRLYLTFETA